MIKTIKMALASLLMFVMGLQMSMAQGLSENDMAFAFGGAASGAVQEIQRSAPAPQMLRAEEMEATEGEFWPLVYGAAVWGTRAVMWAAPRLSSRFVTRFNPKSQHTLMFGRNNKHICHVGCDRFGSHVGWGSGGRNGYNARNHIYRNNPWRINPH